MGSVIGAVVKISSLFISYLKETKLKSLEPKKEIRDISVNNKFIIHDGTLEDFMLLLESLRYGQKYDTEYIHKDAVKYLIQAYYEKRERDGLPVVTFRKSNLKELSN
jgi:hypothetical protein